MEIQNAGDDVKISGLTWDKFTDVVKGTWHLIGLLLVLIWYVASYKAGLDLHLSTIDQQMKIEDNKLNWIINHHADKDPMPMDDQHPYIPQAEHIKPQSLTLPPRIAESLSPQISSIPETR